MRFTLNITMLEPDQYIPLAQAAEAAGFYAASVSDSIFYPKEVIGEYPYHKGREFLDGKPFIEPFVAIGAMAASTKTLRFSTYVLKMAIREPLVLAKSVLSASAFFLAVSASSAAFFLASSSFSLPALGSFFAVGLALLFSFTVLPSVFASDFASEGVALSVGLMVSRLAGTVVFLMM